MDKEDLDFESLFDSALGELTCLYNGNIEKALHAIGVYEEEKIQAIKDWWEG